MYTLAYILLIVSLVASAFGAAFGLTQANQGSERAARLIEKGHYLVTGGFLVASLILLYALGTSDYRVEYVAGYTDNALGTFYKYAAFWAGQHGSMLFWALAVAIMGSIFAFTPAYRAVSPATRIWFWIFFFSVTAFFATLLALWSNPFMQLDPAPVDGRGLNPLLQNPGMILHPPLLFLGYGGFTVPSCMALAQAVTGRGSDRAWYDTTRVLFITAWCFLTAGIMLGAWWAYMELGWGGYWAWDPVENASLIPWLVGTAALHTLVVERARGKLTRVNTLLISLTTIAGFFATYLVRSGVIDSVHAFGLGPVGKPLLVFMCFALVVTLLVVVFSEKGRGELENPLSREGALLLTAWIFLVLGFIILTATMWPVISRIWSDAPLGLEADFYNRVCLPLASLLLLLLALCPWLSWRWGIQGGKGLALSVIGGLLVAGAAYYLNYEKIHPLVSQFAAGAIAVGSLIVGFRVFGARGAFRFGSIGTHLGVALCAIGIAFSGPYKATQDMVLEEGAVQALDKYQIRLKATTMDRALDYEYLRATLEVLDRDGNVVSVLNPEKRAYDKFQGMMFSEVDVAASFGKEVYASVSGLDSRGRTVVQVSIEPMVSWLWLGGAVMSILPLFNLARRRSARRREDDIDNGIGDDADGGPNGDDDVESTDRAARTGPAGS